MEVTFRHADAPRCIEQICKELPEMNVGAGTLLNESQIQLAVNAGAQFGVTPGFNPATIRAAQARKFPLIPGTATPGEMEQALAMGCSTVKYFPAEASGGLRMHNITNPIEPSGEMEIY